MKRNPLKAFKPPRYFHRIRDESRVRGMTFEHPEYGTVGPHHGIHTSGSFNIAAAYAMGTWRQSGFEGYPVVIAIDVTGLEPFHDVDAELIYREYLKDRVQLELEDMLEGGDDLHLIADMLFDYVDDDYQPDTPESAVFQHSQGRASTNIVSTILNHYHNYDEAESLVRSFVKTGKLPGDVLMELVDQRRYLDDLGEDRVYFIQAFRPWFAHLVDEWAPNGKRVIKEAKKAGWHVVTLEDTYDYGGDFHPGDIETLYKRPGKQPKEVQYHGTVSFLAADAFPDIELPDPDANIWNLDLDM